MAAIEKRQIKPQPFNGKAVFVKDWDDGDAFTLGKVYEFKDGRTIDDDGYKRPLMVLQPTTTSDWWFKDHFVQLIE